MKLTKKTAQRIVCDLANKSARGVTLDTIVRDWATQDKSARRTFGRLLYQERASGDAHVFRSTFWACVARMHAQPLPAQVARAEHAARILPAPDWWSLLESLGERYGVAVARPNLPTVQSAPDAQAAPAQGGAVSAWATGAQPDPASTPSDVMLAGARIEELDPGAAELAPSLYATALRETEELAASGTDRLLTARALSRTLKSDTRDHERVHEDGDRLRSDGASVVAAGLTHESALAYTVRRRSDKPAVMILTDWSGSMRTSVRDWCEPAARTVYALADACRAARVPCTVYGFGGAQNGAHGLDVQELAPFGGRPVFHAEEAGGTPLSASLLRILPRFAARRERRKLCLVVTDGEITDDSSYGTLMPRAAAYARSHGIELYGIGLGVDLANLCTPAEWTGRMRLDNPEDLRDVASRELARVIHK